MLVSLIGGLIVATAATIFHSAIKDIFSNMTEKPLTYLKGVAVTTDRDLKTKVLVNNFTIMADLAINTDQQIKGLSIKDKLQENEGMLFVFKEPSEYGFWMKGMKFPIDITWLDTSSI